MAFVLIVEDDVELNAITKVYLEHGGFETVSAYTYAQAESEIDHNKFDIILLDLMLPDQGGENLCKKIRKKTDCSIIFISCIDEKETIMHAFESGGDDYMVKPVDYDILVAKMNSMIRRTNLPNENNNILRFKQFYIDIDKHQVVRTVKNDSEVDLSPIEYKLICNISHNKENIVLYEDLYSSVWGNDSCGDVRTVMVHISNLRKKIDPNQTGTIITVRGVGYLFKDIEDHNEGN